VPLTTDGGFVSLSQSIALPGNGVTSVHVFATLTPAGAPSPTTGTGVTYPVSIDPESSRAHGTPRQVE
jgi:hypothetical protein